MQRLWTNPIKVKFVKLTRLPSFSLPLSLSLSGLARLQCVIFQTISLNMCFGFQSAAVKTP